MARPGFGVLRSDWRASLPEPAATRVDHLDQSDLQGNVLCGYGNDFCHALYLFVRVNAPLAGRRWVGELAAQVTDAMPWAAGHRPSATVNVALSHAGLAALGVPRPVLGSFPEEFRMGMAERGSELGDLDRSAPANWEQELRGEAHALVTVTARSEPALERRVQALLEYLAGSDGALELAYVQRADLLPPQEGDLPRREHFGFADGFSQPAIKGNAGPTQRDGMGTPTKRGRWRNVAPGEFVLGYKGEDGVAAQRPAEPLRRSGSFMVVRKLEQHVERFHDFLAETAGADPLAQRKLGARLVGRWQDGRSLVLDLNPYPRDPREGPGRREELRRINRFLYHAQDADGLRCPLGAHVRRANPRDEFGGQFGWHGKLTKRHRIIRRGMPYDDRQARDGGGRGLMFVCYQASIERQFEVIQKNWLNDGDAFWLGAEKDPLTIRQAPAVGVPDWPEPAFGDGRTTIQGDPPTFVRGGLPFVTTRGGGYYFTPGIGALRALASAYWL